MLMHIYAGSHPCWLISSRDMPFTSCGHATCLDAYPTHVLQAWGGVRHMAPELVPAHPARTRARTHALARRRATCLLGSFALHRRAPCALEALHARTHALHAAAISPHSSQGLARYRRIESCSGPWRGPSPADSLSKPPFLPPRGVQVPSDRGGFLFRVEWGVSR